MLYGLFFLTIEVEHNILSADKNTEAKVSLLTIPSNRNVKEASELVRFKSDVS